MGIAIVATASLRVLYASKCGVRFDGSDQSAQLQAVLNEGQSGPLLLIIDGSCMAGGLKLYSGTTVEGLGWNTVITQATATSLENSCTFRNAHYVSSYQNQTIQDSNIAIRNLRIDCNARNGSSGTANPNWDPDGAPLAAVRMWGVNDLITENLYIYDLNSYGVHPANSFHVTARDLTGICIADLGPTPAMNNGTNVIQFDGPWDDVLVDGIHGYVGDDFVALNAIDGDIRMAYASIFFYGPGGTAIIRNLYPACCGNVVRLLCGLPSNQSGQPPAGIDKVLVEGVQGVIHGSMFISNTFGGATPGMVGDVTFRDWHLTHVTPYTTNPDYNNIDGNYRSWTMVGFRLRNLPAAPGQPIFHVPNATTSIGRLALSDFVVREDAGETTTPPSIIGMSAGTVDEMLLDRLNWSRYAATAIPAVAVSGGTVNTLRCVGVSVNNISSVAAISGGNVPQINSTGLVHRNAGGAASFAQSGTGTVGGLVASASTTAKLTSGTITKRSDATELS